MVVAVEEDRACRRRKMPSRYFNCWRSPTADVNLDIDAIFALGAGLAQMFTRIALRHGVNEEFISK
jgi:hypothetical protein